MESCSFYRRGVQMSGAILFIYACLLNSSIEECEKYRYLEYVKTSVHKTYFRENKFKIFERVFLFLMC